MSAEEKDDLHYVATHLARSLRGQHIIGQALAIAVKIMSKVPKPYREESHIEDMEFLLEHLYPPGFASMVAAQMLDGNAALMYPEYQIELFEKNTTSEGDASGTEKEKD